MLVGSRRYIPNAELPEGTDWDFIGIDTEAERGWLRVNGWRPTDFGSIAYKDISTSSMYHRLDEVGNKVAVQVSLKHEASMEDVIKVWVLMDYNPSLYIHYIWKKNCDIVERTRRFDMLVHEIVPYVYLKRLRR
jgi:hypothetical protein